MILSPKIALPISDGMCYLPVESIIRVQAEGTYARVILQSNTPSMTVCKVLKDFEKVLLQHQFIRVHRTHLVNLRHIRSFHRSDGGYLVMNNGDEVPVSRRGKDWVQQQLMELAHRV